MFNIKKSVLIIITAIIIIIGVSLYFFVSALAKDTLALRGPVQVLHNPKATWVVPEAEISRTGTGNWTEIVPGHKFSDDSVLRTGEFGNVDISFTEGTLIRIAEDTIVKINDLTLSKVDMSLEKGSLISKFNKVTGNEMHKITTPSIVCGVRGTELIVEIHNDDTLVYGMSGETEVASVDHPGSPVLVGFQQKTTVKDGQLPDSPSDMTPEEIRRFRRLLDSMHSSEVFFVASDLKFKPDSAELVPESAVGLEDLAKIINRKKLQIEIVGHTADVGDRASQYELSWKRAEAVKEELLSLGVKEKRLTTKGYGGLKPMADNSTPEGRARNRRVEFLIKD